LVGLHIARFCPCNCISDHMKSHTGYLLALIQYESLPGPCMNERKDREAIAVLLLRGNGKRKQGSNVVIGL
jgi:hypothetical protein